MNVLYVTSQYLPHTGGVENHVAELAERLVERGHDVTVYTADAGTNVESRETRNGVKVRRYFGLAPGDAFHVAPSITPAVRNADADVVHAHNYHSLPVLFAALAVTDEPFVVTPHYHGGSASPIRDVLLGLYRFVGGWALGQADSVVAVSEWESERLRKDFGISSTRIPNGIHVGRFRDCEPVKRDRPYVLFVGRLEKYKGVQHIIRALDALPEFDLLIAGSGPYKDTLEAEAHHQDVADRVTFLGYVSDADLPRYYAGATVFTSLSSFEAYGLTVGEALASGTPSVVRKATALTDWTAYEGCLGISSVEPSAVAESIRAAVGREPDPDALPTWDSVTDAIEKSYKALSNT